jgi:hypothetical protein
VFFSVGSPPRAWRRVCKAACASCENGLMTDCCAHFTTLASLGGWRRYIVCVFWRCGCPLEAARKVEPCALMPASTSRLAAKRVVVPENS